MKAYWPVLVLALALGATVLIGITAAGSVVIVYLLSLVAR